MKRPPQGKALYEALLASRSEDAVVAAISDGILALCSNAHRLLEEAKFLREHGHLATAYFLLRTADEETAKVYILLDIVRLEFEKHEEQMRKLCNAFYSHIAKAAYMEVTRFTDEFVNMEHVKDVFEAERIEFFRGNYESGEPDMPSMALSGREWNLYVDYNAYDDDWMVPGKFIHDDFTVWSLFEKAESSLAKLEKTRDCGLFGLDCLQILHEEFSKKFVTVSTSDNEIKNMYSRVLSKIQQMGITLPEEGDNALLEWPLYSFL
jgi:AbiV family abortive infection protein